MMKFIKRNMFINKVLFILYKYVLPGFTIFILVGIATFNNHVVFLNKIFDLFIRIIISIWFYRLYTALSKDEKMGISKYMGNDQNNANSTSTYLYAVILGIFTIFLTFWIITQYFRISGYLNFVISICNGILIAFPQISRLPNSKWQ